MEGKSERVEDLIIEDFKREGEGEQWGATEGFSAKEGCLKPRLERLT